MLNGIAFLLYAISNFIAPSSFFVPPEAPGYALDVLRVLSVGYLAMGLIQLGSWFVNDRLAIQIGRAADETVRARNTGEWPSGKGPDYGSGIKSLRILGRPPCPLRTR